MNRTIRLAAFAVLASFAASCGGGGDAEPTTPTTTTTPETTVPDTVGPTDAPTTTAADVPVYPLTGLPVTDPVAAARPALVVKIDNNAKARPQSGLNAADIVFEEIVEVQSRFAAVFHSQLSDPVGPIRSGRTQDIDLLGSFDRPLLLWSGGNRRVTDAIEASDLVNLSAQIADVYRAAGFYRADDRPGPHDLYAQTSLAWTLAPADAGPPPQQFQYLEPGAEPEGEPSAGVDGDMDGLPVEWRYDGATGSYRRSNGGTPHEDAATGQITTENVVVMEVVYQPSPADARSPEAQTIGAGTAMVFTGGVLVRGTWTRADRLSPIVFMDADGDPILFTPGRTWIELARPGTFQPVA